MSNFIHNENMKPRNTAQSLKKLGIFTLAEASEVGFSQPTISRLVSGGEVLRIQQGIYRHKDAQVDFEHLDLIVAAKRFGPDAVIGLMSALAYYSLIEQVPQQIWVLVPPQVKTTSRLYRCVRTKTNLVAGIDRHRNYAITNLERTIVEAFKYSSKVGLDVAVYAARTAIKRQLSTPAKLLKQAKALKMERYIIRHWEAITAA
jgi:predicted transcriptional regulator of viral defense system